MTDHRVTDLSYGLPGKATYDVEEKHWEFSVNFDQKSTIEQISPLTQCVPNSFENHPLENGPYYNATRSQMKWLCKVHPETVPATSVIAAYVKAAFVSQRELSSKFGSLLAAGYAHDPNRISGTRAPRIVAFPGPEADTLQLFRPRVEVRGWGKKWEASLELFDLKSADHGYWAGVGGGIIRQVLFRDDEDEPKKLFAVRQDRATTILRPLFGNGSNPPLSKRHSKIHATSRINPNPIARLTAEATGSETHEDVTFNPWYSSQFAVVDSLGRWSTWSLESQPTSERLIPGKSGQLYDDLPKAAPEDHADGWYRILWVCNASALVLCGRQHLAVFNIEGNPTRFQGGQILPSNSKEWILDMKRCTSNWNYIYVLTTSRIFWVEVISNEEGTGQIKIILSYRHFRDANDETMRLTPVKDQNVSILISSEKSLVVNFYNFCTNTTGLPTSWKGSFNLIGDHKDKKAFGIHSLCFLPALVTNGNSQSSPSQWFEPNTKFFQILVLNPELGLSSTLCAIYNSNHEGIAVSRSKITEPTRTIRRFGGRLASQAIDDHFIIPDGCEEYALGEDQNKVDGNPLHDSQDPNDLRLRINWRNVFRQIFSPTNPGDITNNCTLADILTRVNGQLEDGVEKEMLAASTLNDLSNQPILSDELDKASSTLRDYLSTLQLDSGLDFPAELIMSDLTVGSEVFISRTQDSENLDLLKVFDHLVGNWMATLPLDVSNAARGAKFRIIHQLAFELSMSSVALSLRNKASSIKIPTSGDVNRPVSVPPTPRDPGYLRDSSPARFSSQLAALPDHRMTLGLPTPDPTPSLYSHPTSASELLEDLAITRLRQYAVSIQAKPDFGRSSILSHWSSIPGQDPAEYSWGKVQKAAENAEDDYAIRKEEARRRRRTERFLRQERARAAGSMSQPMLPELAAPFGSQPELQYQAISSQLTDDLPMTQPDRGTFGSRAAQKTKKKQKKQRAAGFR